METYFHGNRSYSRWGALVFPLAIDNAYHLNKIRQMEFTYPIFVYIQHLP